MGAARRYGAIEAGGTKFVCGVGTGPDDLDVESFPTTGPDETLARVVASLRARGPLDAVGIGCFGPLSLREGMITEAPKRLWRNVEIVRLIREALGLPVGIDTDVNAAALGEHRWGAARGVDTFVYLTVGTGIGGGAMVGGKMLHGMLHPEMGHMRIPRDLAQDPFPGNCPIHGDCAEGLAAGPSLRERWGAPAESLAEGHAAWALEARYLALICVNLICTLSPRRIILGGGVMQQAHLFSLIRRNVQALLNGYIRCPEMLDRIDAYIVAPGLGDRAGVLGALVLAERAAATSSGVIRECPAG